MRTAHTVRDQILNTVPREPSTKLSAIYSNSNKKVLFTIKEKLTKFPIILRQVDQGKVLESECSALLLCNLIRHLQNKPEAFVERADR